MKEVWKAIPKYEGIYEASNLGKIRSLRFRNRVLEKSLDIPRILKQSNGPQGYLVIRLSKNNIQTMYRVHRLVLKTFIPGFDHLEVNHKNLKRSDNRLSNLEWVTAKQNSAHRIKNKLKQLRGEE